MVRTLGLILCLLASGYLRGADDDAVRSADQLRIAEEKCWNRDAATLFGMFRLVFDEKRMTKIRERYQEIHECLKKESLPTDLADQVFAILNTDDTEMWNRFYTRLEKALDRNQVKIYTGVPTAGRGETITRMLYPFYDQINASENFDPHYPSELEEPFLQYVLHDRSVRDLFPDGLDFKTALIIPPAPGEGPRTSAQLAWDNFGHARGSWRHLVPRCALAIAGVVVVGSVFYYINDPSKRSEAKNGNPTQPELPTEPAYDSNDDVAGGFRPRVHPQERTPEFFSKPRD